MGFICCWDRKKAIAEERWRKKMVLFRLKHPISDLGPIRIERFCWLEYLCTLTWSQVEFFILYWVLHGSCLCLVVAVLVNLLHHWRGGLFTANLLLLWRNWRVFVLLFRSQNHTDHGWWASHRLPKKTLTGIVWPTPLTLCKAAFEFCLSDSPSVLLAVRESSSKSLNP